MVREVDVREEPGRYDVDMQDPFEEARPILFGVAYRVTGSVSDAEDVVQDAWLRWSSVAQEAIDEPRAFLVTEASRLSIDRLRRRKSRVESYTGTWLPEPLLTTPDPSERAELTESLAVGLLVGLLVVLESLSPLERAVFVLREAFAYDYAAIAGMVGRQEPAVRQLAARARRHVAEGRVRYHVDPITHRQATDHFLAASSSGDVDRLVELLAPEVTLVADGGGKVRAPLLSVIGSERVVRFLASVVERSGEVVDAEVVRSNGSDSIKSASPGSRSRSSHWISTKPAPAPSTYSQTPTSCVCSRGPRRGDQHTKLWRKTARARRPSGRTSRAAMSRPFRDDAPAAHGSSRPHRHRSYDRRSRRPGRAISSA